MQAGGTVRWGLRAGHDAWPDRSAPASAVREIAFNGWIPSSPRVWGLGLPLFPGLRPFFLPDCVLRGLGVGANVLEIRGMARQARFRLLDGFGSLDRVRH